MAGTKQTFYSGTPLFNSHLQGCDSRVCETITVHFHLCLTFNLRAVKKTRGRWVEDFCLFPFLGLLCVWFLPKPNQTRTIVSSRCSCPQGAAPAPLFPLYIVYLFWQLFTWELCRRLHQFLNVTLCLRRAAYLNCSEIHCSAKLLKY